jgi:hypothetical protein
MVLPGVSLAEGNGARRFGAMGSKMKMGCEIPSGYLQSGKSPSGKLTLLCLIGKPSINGDGKSGYLQWKTFT